GLQERPASASTPADGRPKPSEAYIQALELMFEGWPPEQLKETLKRMIDAENALPANKKPGTIEALLTRNPEYRKLVQADPLSSSPNVDPRVREAAGERTAQPAARPANDPHVERSAPIRITPEEPIRITPEEAQQRQQPQQRPTPGQQVQRSLEKLG